MTPQIVSTWIITILEIHVLGIPDLSTILGLVFHELQLQHLEIAAKEWWLRELEDRWRRGELLHCRGIFIFTDIA